MKLGGNGRNFFHARYDWDVIKRSISPFFMLSIHPFGNRRTFRIPVGGAAVRVGATFPLIFVVW